MHQRQVLRSITNTMYAIASLAASAGVALLVSLVIILSFDLIEFGYYVRLALGILFLVSLVVATVLLTRLYLSEEEIHKRWFMRVVKRKDLYTMTARIVDRSVDVDASCEKDTGEIVVKHTVTARISNGRLSEDIVFYGRKAYRASLGLNSDLIRIDVVEWIDKHNRLIARSFALRAPIR